MVSRLLIAGIMVILGIGDARVVQAQSMNSSNAVESFGQGAIDWTVGEVYATGIGAPPANAVNAAQARAMADRAAMVVAYRNLLEIVKGVQVDSETVVENFMTKSDIIRTRVDGIVKGARIVKKQSMSDGSIEITLAMPMKGAFMNAVVPTTFGVQAPSVMTPSMSTPKPSPSTSSQPAKPQTPVKPEAPKQEPPKTAAPTTSPAQEKKPELPKQEPTPAPSAQSASNEPTVQFKGGKATGIVIDGRGLGLKPALLPKIVDQQGQEIYVGQVVARTNAVEQGVAGYAKDVNAAANNFRVTDNPAIMRGIRASGAARTDVMLGQADAQTLKDLGKQADFLQFCRVIIVY